MIGVLTLHWAKDDLIEEARELLNRNGDAQSRELGFEVRGLRYSYHGTDTRLPVGSGTSSR